MKRVRTNRGVQNPQGIDVEGTQAQAGVYTIGNQHACAAHRNVLACSQVQIAAERQAPGREASREIALNEAAWNVKARSVVPQGHQTIWRRNGDVAVAS